MKNKSELRKLLVLSILMLFCFLPYNVNANDGVVKTKIEVDVCVYGSTGAGIFASLAAAREGYSVVIIEPFYKIGGLLGTGFRMQQDSPTGSHLGGLTGYFYKKDVSQAPLRHHQAAANFNLTTFNVMISDYDDLITIITDHRLESVNLTDGEINEAIFEFAPVGRNGAPLPKRYSENLLSVKAKVYIDASYEGDLMAYSGVSYRIGKESKEEYNESLAGIVLSKKFPGVDPYVEKGNPKSGLLSIIDPNPVGEEGDSSIYFMLYNFKLAFENNPTKENPGIPISPPEKRIDDVYELLKRYTDAGYNISWPEENFNRNQLMTGSIPGMQLKYPDGDWATRSEIWQRYIDYVKTLNDFSGTEIRLVSGINDKTNGWPYLYVRCGRRMIGEYVMTQKDIQLQTKPPTPIGMGYYKIDIYPNRMVVLEDGTLALEGNVFVLASPGPYQIPYGAIIPKSKECKNLLVPICMSASHVAYSSLRMEATYMIIGESAGIAAALAIKEGNAVQDIDREELTAMLIKYGQILEWDGLGYNFGWRSNIFGNGHKEVTRWETNPEEYSKYPVEILKR
jgi:hypothetical protein